MHHGVILRTRQLATGTKQDTEVQEVYKIGQQLTQHAAVTGWVSWTTVGVVAHSFPSTVGRGVCVIKTLRIDKSLPIAAPAAAAHHGSPAAGLQ